MSNKIVELVTDSGDEAKINWAANVLKYAVMHHDIIKQFGRFPHRNEVLGRESTKEETEYLVTGQRFGQ